MQIFAYRDHVDVQGLSVPMVRRHTKGVDNSQHMGPQVQTVSGNYVAAKRKGVVNGVDLGYTGMVCSQTTSVPTCLHQMQM